MPGLPWQENSRRQGGPQAHLPRLSGNRPSKRINADEVTHADPLTRKGILAMADTFQISGTTLSMILGGIGSFIGLLLFVIGYFVNDKLGSIQMQNAKFSTDLGTLAENAKQTDTHIAEMKTHVAHHAGKMDEFCDRLKSVETSVLNTERIAVLERSLAMQEKEINELRHWRHSMADGPHIDGLKRAIAAERASMNERLEQPKPAQA
jgi:uncharacterized coiled-coil protein SlyX